MVDANFYINLTQDEHVRKYKRYVKINKKKNNTLTQFRNKLWKYISSLKLTFIII